ncbi:unnamed protein product [Trichobilharzia regenti]|uniref:Transmembrane protein 45B n=1 Tax=Trichobilharzia regenti TaxID=157069 RepID=A0A183X0X7_TRIRE|nr:unnamed protein product [Trichobilharzia regenti]VDQ13909.1 unnamed protein product [Trichobilharzia regenti]
MADNKTDFSVPIQSPEHHQHSYYFIQSHEHNGGHEMSLKTIGNEGLFLSHSYLGVFLICLGLWWWIQALRKCYTSMKRNHIEEYTASITHGSSCCCCGSSKSRLGEGSCKLIISLIGIIIELISLKFNRPHEYAYFPFYTSMCLASLLDILIATIITPPNGIDYIAHALPFFILTYCSRAQSFQQTLVTQTTRLLISYWGFFTGSSIISEMILNKSVIWTWIKCFAVIFQGSWIFNTGIILNPINRQPWDEDSHENLMYAVIIFVWHMFFIIIAQLMILLIIAKCYNASPNWTLNDLTPTTTTGGANNKFNRISTSGPNSVNSRDNIEYTKLLNNSDYAEE